MTVFKFKLFYDVNDTDYQERYVIAETGFEAMEKIEAYYNEPGLLKPCFISDPEVEIDYVIA